jgi:hypothetical protein
VNAAPPGRSGLVDRLAKSSALSVGVSVLTIVGGLIAIISFALYAVDRWGGGDGTTAPPEAMRTPSSSGPTPVPSSGPPPPSVTDPTVHSVCLSDQQDEVDCREPHRLERFGGSCSTAGMLEYMAGRAGRDVVLADVREVSGACVIDNPIEVAETAAGVLAGSNHDAWRRCLDDRQGRLVPCSKEHTGEYIATGEARKANQEECEKAAEAYMNQTLTNVGDLLTVRVVSEVDPDPSSPRCLIAVRGSQPLTASVRNLGVRPVPIRR